MDKSLVKRALSRLVMREPFIASVLMRMPTKFVGADRIPTAGTDGLTLFINLEWMNSLNPKEIEGVLAHEALHAALAHAPRGRDKNARAWNIACDMVINDIIECEMRLTLPKDGVFMAGARHKQVEELYRDEQQNKGQGSARGNGHNPDLMPPQPESVPAGSTLKQEMAKMKVAVAQAANVAKKMGRLPGALSELLEDTLSAEVDWREVLHRFVDAAASSRLTWKRLNRRFAWQGINLPSRQANDGLRELVFAVDTSGSMCSATLAMIFGEIKSLCAVYEISKLHVVYCDAAVNQHDEFENPEEGQLVPVRVGGGGTAFEPVFELIEEKGINPTALIYATDLYGSFPAEEPGYPVLWMCTPDASERDPNFGETVRLQGE